MGSIRLYGVWFSVWADDHNPPHVHAAYGGVRLVVELRAGVPNQIAVRIGSLQPKNAKRADVRHILRMAQGNFAALLSLWEELHD